MSEDAHRRLRLSVAAYVLGALDPDERTELERHLDQCGECRELMTSFAPIPGLLWRIDPQEPPHDAGPAPARIAEAAIARLGTRRRQQRLRRLVATSAAVVVIVALAASLLTTRSADIPGPGDLRPTAVATEAAAVGGSGWTEAKGWGTEVHLDLVDLPRHERYVLWVVTDRGERQQVATWGPTRGGRAVLTGASSFDAARVERLEVTTADGTALVALTS